MEYIKKKILYLSMISYDKNNNKKRININKDSYKDILESLIIDIDKPIKNNNIKFIGYNKLKELMNNQLIQFRNWSKTNNWKEFHDSHYDWWTFPIPERSSMGFQYSVYEDDIKE